jgi:Rieske 2Fe-2S family protein
MSATPTPEPVADDFTGLKQLTRGLPAAWYFDRAQYEIELARIWYRNWIYVARSSEVSAPRAYITFALGDQVILLVRDDDGRLQGFHNTCRHRGAALCPEGHGSLRSSVLVCPYHAWAYNLQGELLRTSSKSIPTGFLLQDFALYNVKVTEWRGFIFISLSDKPPALQDTLKPQFDRLDHWPLEDLRLAHVMTKTIQCNWKLFWENFSECLHCPGVHPRLSQLVPIFGRGLLRERDDPDWRAHADDPDPKYKGGLRSGAASWSMDGSITGSVFSGLTAEDRRAGQIYMTSLPSGFIAAHVDYVRVVRVRPLGPVQTELRVEYLFALEAIERPDFDPSSVVNFTNLVMSEDARICEVNQRGLPALAHESAVLMPEEYVVYALHEWIRSHLTRT